MENPVKINDELYINLQQAVKIQVCGETIVVYLRECDGSLTGNSSQPGYNKLKKILDECVRS